MPHAYTEDELVEQPAIGLFAELGWTTVSALEEIFGPAEPSPHPSPSGRGSEGEGRVALLRETKGEVVLVSRLRKALGKLNPSLPPEAITAAVDELSRDRSATGAVSEAEGDQCHAASGAHLRELLRGNHRYVFTLIHKFQPEKVRAETPSSPALLPAGEERTKSVFGDYVSIYDFQQSVEDGATVPLFYENRTPELQLVNPDLNEDIYNIIEAAELDPDQEAKLERELSRQYHILTRDDRLETVAKDIVRHFLGRGFQGKAMVVSIDKAMSGL